MSGRYLLHGRVLTPAHDVDAASLLIEDGTVIWLRPGLSPARDAERLTRPGDIIVPGFIDLQVNGFGGCDAMAGAEAVSAISARLPEFGVTAFLPTITTRPLEEGVAFVGAVGRAAAPGARLLGAHVEGPFLNPRFRGVHEARFMVEPTPERVDALLAAGPRLVTLAPELPGALEAAQRFSGAGVLVGAGHTGASFEEAQQAVAAGVRFATHVFNAMAAMRHREPGAVAAFLLDRRVTVGLVADGVHVAPAVMDLVVRARGGARIALTTDQTAAAGGPPGRYRLGKIKVISDGRVVRRLDGTLAGSAATMDDLVRQTASLAGLRRAVAMASAAPARALKLAGLGRIGEGLPADLVVLDESLRVRTTLVGGRIAYRRHW
jgi:N-acetylglucosamine-6-phosphate deacetylase